MVKICGGVPHIVPTLAEENYELSASALESALMSCANPTCVILCNPSNPSGCVSSLESFQKLAKVFEKYPQVPTYIHTYIYVSICCSSIIFT